MNGDYEFTIVGVFNIYAYFYVNYFEAVNAFWNLIAENHTYGNTSQLKITVNLRAYKKYYLVVTSAIIWERESFSIVAYGPSQVNFISTQTSSKCSYFIKNRFCSDRFFHNWIGIFYSELQKYLRFYEDLSNYNIGNEC
jgi:hypothetical protein